MADQDPNPAGHPHRLRRLRRTPALRRMTRETRLSPDCLVAPLFVRAGVRVRRPVPSMPGVFQMSPDAADDEARALAQAGVPAVILFGIPEQKDGAGSSALDSGGVVPRAIEAIHRAAPGLAVITDLCLCEYTDHGHCGLLAPSTPQKTSALAPAASAPAAEGWEVANDATVARLADVALAHARAGADMIAPSDMMDQRIGAIRARLDAAGFSHLPLMAYAAKFASAFYGPFRDAAESPPKFGDRASYQMDPANGREALREVALDVEEGADIVMVKPALAYLDIVRAVRERFDLPIAVYNVSGEYSMVKAAAAAGWLDEKKTALEMLVSMKRAGADIIITYWAQEAAGWLASGDGEK
ncbi:MAG: porphobilinogen synthase [Planctomycetes bacterium]|nr:porphobilinogen synthase [Planctomycetota bacterium]